MAAVSSPEATKSSGGYSESPPRESMVEVLLAFNVVVLQSALVARSHKLPGTHQLSVNWRRHSSGPRQAAQPLDQGWYAGGWVRDRLLSGRPLENCASDRGRISISIENFNPSLLTASIVFSGVNLFVTHVNDLAHNALDVVFRAPGHTDNARTRGSPSIFRMALTQSTSPAPKGFFLVE